MKHVYDEFNESFDFGFLSKKVTKNFAFTVPNVDVPLSCDYLEVNPSHKIPFHFELKMKFVSDSGSFCRQTRCA